MTCGKAIAWYDNIPLVSYIVLRGRCRNCGASIGLRYPAVELVTALLVSGCVWKFGLHLEALIAVFFCAALVAIAAADLELASGLVKEAFERLIGTVRRTSDEDRTKAREHLVELFGLFPPDDEQVVKARRALAAALY